MSREKGMGLLLAQADRKFAVSFGSTSQATSMLARYTHDEGEEIDLVTGLINLLASEEDALAKDDLQGLTTLFLHEMEIRFDRFKQASQQTGQQYGIRAQARWEPDLNFWSDDATPLRVLASLQLIKQRGERVTGEVRGLIQTPLAGLEFLKMGVSLRLERRLVGGKEIKDTRGRFIVDRNTYFLISMGEVTFAASFKKTNANLTLNFRVEFTGQLTLGDVITFFVSLVDPSVEEYEFDPPWQFLSEFDLGSFLKDLQLTYTQNKDQGESSFSFKLATPPNLIPRELRSVLSVTSFGLGFTSTKGSGRRKSKRKVNVLITGNFLSKTYSERKPLRWDPVDGKPPEIPGKGGSVFELRYLGLGQRVGFTQAAQIESIKDVMLALRGTLDTQQTKLQADRSLSLGSPQKSFLGTGNPIAFRPESEWLVGLDVSLLKMLNLSLIFNDPVIYGLRIELYGAAAKNFQGFVFEILYTKVTESTGKYHGELVLPDQFRRMDFGPATIVLPGIIVDVYTNGDFGVDLGFPRNFDFSLSFALEIFPFVGAGGFYFRKLSAETATSTPRLAAADKGLFTPVYEFGLGLRLGLGKSFKKGPLEAEISITLQGMIEGVISWYRPTDGGPEHLYYKLRGGIRIVGRLYGAIDFVVISVEIEVIARATIQFVLERFKDIQILLEAEVSVEATVTILGIEVDKKFEMKLKQAFTIDSPEGYHTPWLVG